jgi:hypothetical protein
MNVVQWARRSAARIHTDGVAGVKESARPVYHKILEQYSRIQDPGTAIYERDWDLLIVVDAFRLDLMKEVVNEYSYCSDLRSFRSLDSTTALWMRKNFTGEYTSEMSRTGYVCGNPFSEAELTSNSFGKLNEVWRSSWEDPGTVPPRTVTDETVRMMREESHEWAIAHYMQPHCPFIPTPELSRGKERDRFGEQEWRDVWELLRDGDISLDEVWDGYRQNLKLVLSDIEVLLRSVDADRVIITSDHGNAIGELGVYGHPPGMPHDCLRVVPWIETTASDDGTYEPTTEFETGVGVERDEQLAALGYK